MMQSQLARNSQVQAARARLASRRGGIPGGAEAANLAGCGYVDPAMGGAPIGVQEYPGGPPAGLPIPPSTPAIFQQTCVPCAVIAQSDLAGSTTVQITPRNGAFFNIGGLSSCNNCFEVLVSAISTGSAEVNLLPCGQIDIGIYNTDDCFCCFDGGCISTLGPATIEFEPFGTPSVAPFLNMTFWGVSTRGAFDCGWPYGVPVPPYAAVPRQGYSFVGGMPAGGGGPGAYGPGGPNMGGGGYGGNGGM